MTRLRIVITGAGNRSKEQRTSSHLTSTIPARFRQKEPNEQEETMRQALWLCAAAVGVCAAAATPATAVEKPKYGGTLTYMIPEDSPPSFDAQREETYATIHSAAPFYSTLIRINPMNPGSTSDIVCDVCTEMPEPSDGGKTYTFKIRDDVKFHNGDKLTAYDVAASLNKIAFPPQGTLSPRSATFMMVKGITAPDAQTVIIHLKFATRTSTGTSTTFSAPGPSSSPAMTRARRSRGCATPTTTTRGCPILTASKESMHQSRQCSSMRSAPTGPRPSSAAIHPPRWTN